MCQVVSLQFSAVDDLKCQPDLLNGVLILCCRCKLVLGNLRYRYSCPVRCGCFRYHHPEPSFDVAHSHCKSFLPESLGSHCGSLFGYWGFYNNTGLFSPSIKVCPSTGVRRHIFRHSWIFKVILSGTHFEVFCSNVSHEILIWLPDVPIVNIQDDKYSHDVTQQLLVVVVPFWLKSNKDPTALLQVIIY